MQEKALEKTNPLRHQQKQCGEKKNYIKGLTFKKYYLNFNKMLYLLNNK